MADISYTGKATIRRASPATYGKGDAANVKLVEATHTIPTTTSAGATFKLVRIPSNARISGLSAVAWDDMDDSNDMMLDFGLASVDGNITSDPDAFNNGNDASSAGTAKLIADHANYGKYAWQFVNGQTSDPGGELDVYVTVTDHATTKAGDVTLTLAYTLD